MMKVLAPLLIIVSLVLWSVPAQTTAINLAYRIYIQR